MLLVAEPAEIALRARKGVHPLLFCTLPLSVARPDASSSAIRGLQPRKDGRASQRLESALLWVACEGVPGGLGAEQGLLVALSSLTQRGRGVDLLHAGVRVYLLLVRLTGLGSGAERIDGRCCACAEVRV